MTDQVRPESRVTTIDALRGLASLAVCWFHFTHGNPAFLSDGILKQSGNSLWAGVELFFVISGFVIPYSLFKAKYTIGNFHIFCWKRILRLDPPYLIVVVLIILLDWLSRQVPGFAGDPFHFSLPQALAHLGYLNFIFGYSWYNPVFWTLAIEFQYYLLMGIAFPLLAHSNRLVRLLSVTILGAIAFVVPGDKWIFFYLLFFLNGIVTFMYKVKLMGRAEYLGSLVVLFVATCLLNGVWLAVLGTVAALLIAFVEIKFRWLVWVGAFSYSLYLLHVPIGGRVVNLALRFHRNELINFLVVLGALTASCGAAIFLYYFVEKPSQRLSSAVRYRPEK